MTTKTPSELKDEVVELTRKLASAEASKKIDVSAHNDVINDLKAELREVMDLLDEENVI
jgi:F0F1-type ATP synthase membrane subunit b/b'